MEDYRIQIVNIERQQIILLFFINFIIIYVLIFFLIFELLTIFVNIFISYKKTKLGNKGFITKSLKFLKKFPPFKLVFSKKKLKMANQIGLNSGIGAIIGAHSFYFEEVVYHE